jgi:hypothetical protein
LEHVSTGLEPFAGLEFGHFAAFLRQAEEYRRTGAVRVPPPLNPDMEKAQTALRTAVSVTDQLATTPSLDARHFKAEQDRVQHALKDVLTAFLKPLAISVTLKSGPKKDIDAALRNAKSRQIVPQLRAALEGVADEASLHTAVRQEKLRGIVDPLTLDDLKAVATALGVSQLPRGAKKEGVLSAIVMHLTGIRPAAKAARGSASSSAVDQALVRQAAVKLKGLLEESLDPDRLTEDDVKTALDDLKALKLPELQAVAQEAGLEDAGKQKKSILEAVELKLTEARRARDSIQV